MARPSRVSWTLALLAGMWALVCWRRRAEPAKPIGGVRAPLDPAMTGPGSHDEAFTHGAAAGFALAMLWGDVACDGDGASAELGALGDCDLDALDIDECEFDLDGC